MSASVLTRIGRRQAARILAGVGITGVAIALVGTIIAWSFVGSSERTARRSLDLTTDAVGSVSDTIGVARTMLDSVADGLGTVEGTLGRVSTSFDATQGVLQNVAGFTTGQLPTAIETVTTVLPGLADASDAVDRALRALSRAPLGINYDPAVPFGTSVRRLSDSLAALPGQLRSLGTNLQEVSSSSGGLRTDLAALQADLATTNSRLADARALLDRYSSTAEQASSLARATRTDVHVQARNARVLAVLGGLGFAAMQIVPLLIALAWWSAPVGTPFLARPADDRGPGAFV